MNALKHITLLCLALWITQSAWGQTNDTTVVKKKSNFSKNLGIGFGASYSIIGMKSSPYTLVDSTGLTGEVVAKNKLGVNVSLFYNIHAANRLIVRPGIDVHFMKAQLEYDTPYPNKKHSDIFPIAVEIPVHLIWKMKQGTPDADGRQTSLDLLCGLRSSIAIPQFVSLYPTMKETALNIDLGIGMPLKTSKSNFRIEAIYSHGILNLIGDNPQDFHTTSISSLHRSFAGIRFYFN